MMHDEIIAVSATLVQFGFLKQIQICETILVKIAQKVANFDYVLWKQRQSSFSGWFRIDINNCETILV